ncbi:MAG: hypothetical protein Rpha_1081 [Candidatus Ruthia sp. Apha_13_S6]|nr:hypothetical protein [Candidatus Ruthia sp. Apha_13_S6]
MKKIFLKGLILFTSFGFGSANTANIQGDIHVCKGIDVCGASVKTAWCAGVSNGYAIRS